MNRFLMGMLTALGVGLAAGAVAVYFGVLDIAADTPHSPLVYSLIETAREQAIDRQTRDLTAPANLSDTDRARRGAGNYAAMCVGCHLAPGKADSEIRMGLYPTPPDLSRSTKAAASTAARKFWVIKHGIKASGMPAWSKGGMEDEVIWDLVAFLQDLPSLSESQYVALVEASDGHSHGGLDVEADMHGRSDNSVPQALTAGGHEHADGHVH
ncbi:cytochrome c family protein [Sulfuricella denitrificans skB26]|uniref:Cytochrome c family protein n=1 Tax=Sulfuricella denitrificans (strain DSM 22764 / NBRC 105220 / skB26) TaxID=1163617 RepID=S6AII9_SULDS|nr:cytochrome c [Sulfuricella denitrificans]BAN36056.1 cytochrome c family protein [Sulfuricella denitrificans skB26]